MKEYDNDEFQLMACDKIRYNFINVQPMTTNRSMGKDDAGD
jgi:hypothetical protein